MHKSITKIKHNAYTQQKHKDKQEQKERSSHKRFLVVRSIQRPTPTLQIKMHLLFVFRNPPTSSL